jgi:uncharacterized protein (DUF2236 family)
MMFGGPRALLFHLAHPKVAAAVAAHSGFRREPLLRLWRTLDALVLLAFGSARQREAAAARARAVHDRVFGRLREAAGAWRAGASYTAHDARAQSWVLCTLAETSELTYERLVRPFAPGERTALYRDWRALGLAFGIPEPELPATRRDARAHVARMLASGEVAVTDAARELADAVLHPPLPLVPRAAFASLAALTAGLLPRALREAYGLPFGKRERAACARVEGAQRLLFALAPRPRRALPFAYVAARRVVRPALLDAPARG